jgi:hypothetical protein
MPKESGTAISNAIAELSSVPTIAMAAPQELEAELLERRPRVQEERHDDRQQRGQHQQREELRRPMKEDVEPALAPRHRHHVGGVRGICGGGRRHHGTCFHRDTPRI